MGTTLGKYEILFPLSLPGSHAQVNLAIQKGFGGFRKLVILREVLKELEGDEKVGAQIIRRALEEPLRMIVQNAGEEGSVVIGKINDSKDPNFGYNAGTGVYEDLVKAGVIDPTKVTRTALQNAASIAGLMLTTEAMIAEIPEKKEAAGGGHNHGGGGMEGMY